MTQRTGCGEPRFCGGDGKGTMAGRYQYNGLDAGETAAPVAAAMRRLNLSVDQTLLSCSSA